MSATRWVQAVSVAGALALALTACGGDGDDPGSDGDSLSGEIRIDGSSTVAPLGEAAARTFQAENRGVRVTVGTSGTGGGFEKFCNGETDISEASRPIKDEEVAACEANGIAFEEIQVANDALSAVVHPDNPLECITVDQLRQMWDLETPVDSWGDIEGLSVDVPDEPLTLFGPGPDSGTFNYWTETVNGEDGRIRTDYNSIGEDDNAAVNGVSGDPWATAYIPFSYIEEAGDVVKPLLVENPDTGECVAPTLDNVLAGTYAPLGRPLFWYPSGAALQRPEVLTFLEFYIDNQEAITTDATFIPMNDEQAAEAQARVDSLVSGSA
jgi:phosphate transport system substrate-binding protein